MKHLVTGGAGFLGAALCRSLASDGVAVRSLDNLARGRAERLDGVSGLEQISGDVRRYADVQGALEGVSVVWHLAAINGTRNFYERPDEVLEVGLKGSLNIVDAALEAGVKRLIMFSSSEVYQRAETLPTPEEVALVVPEPSNPRYSYGGGKIASELIALHMGHFRGLDVVIVRPHNVYGPDMGEDHVIPELTMRLVRASREQGRAEVTLEIEGAGTETRAFCHIDDALRGLRLIAAQGVAGEIYHLGTDEEVRISDLAESIGESLGLKVRLAASPRRRGSTQRRCPDIAKLKGLGYVPSVSLQKGLGDVVKWYAERVAGGPNGQV